jgi:hypothetical protein
VKTAGVAIAVTAGAGGVGVGAYMQGKASEKKRIFSLSNQEMREAKREYKGTSWKK